MARTPTLRWLQQIASDYRKADALGVSVNEMRDGAAETAERTQRMTPSRRQVLAGAAAMAAGLALSRNARAASNARVAIVGGGISGLSAALTLADAGITATVYESGGRIGGRMFSSNNGYWASNQVSEWCGELIDTNHKTILALCRRFNLPTTDLFGAELNSSEETYKFFGHYYPKVDADKDFQAVHNALQGDVQAASYPTTYQINTPGGRALDAMSVYDWIESRVAGGHRSPMGMLLDVAYNIEYGAETTDQSALNLVYLLGYKASPGNFSMFGGSDERYHIDGGNQQLPLAIANTLANPVQTGMRLSAIRLNADGTYTLTFNGNRDVVADYVVLTLPFAVLRTLDYSRAGFDARKNTAIQQLGAGRNGKLQLQFNTRFWNMNGPWPGISNGATYSDTGYQCTWEVSRGQAGPQGILVDYTGGNTSAGMTTSAPWATASSSQVRADAQRFLSQLEPVLTGATGQWNGKATSSLPFKDTNFNCSYSYWRVGQYVAFSGYEKVRQGNCFFGGEHCSQDFQGFMEGGASEGIRAANEVLTAMGKR